MKNPKYTNHLINDNTLIGKCWNHDRHHYVFARSLSEKGIRWYPCEPRTNLKGLIIFLSVVMLTALAIAGVSNVL